MKNQPTYNAAEEQGLLNFQSLVNLPPALPKYPAYKDSGVEWIGEIPEGWKPSKLAFLGTFLKGSGISRAELTESGLPVILYGDIYTQYDIKTDQLIKFTSEEVAQKAIAIKKGDLLLTGSGETKEDIGKCVAFLGDGKSFAGGDIIILRPNSQNSLFLSYVLNSEKARIEKAKISKGEIIVHIYSSKLRDIYVPLPPLPEQTAIAHYLDEKTALIDTLLRQSEKIIALLQEQRSAIINQAVTKGLTHLPPAQGGTLGVPLKDSGVEWIGEVPESWEVTRLKYATTINPSKSEIQEDVSNELVTFLPMEKVSEIGNIDCSIKRIFSDVSTGFTFFKKQDIIVAKITPCFENGKGAFLSNLETEYGFGSTEFHVLRVKSEFDPKFIFYTTRSERFMKIGETFMTGSAGQKRVPTSFVEDFPIASPDRREQELIGNYLDQKTTEIATLIQKEEQCMALLKEYRAALISEVVTGKARVAV